MQVSGYVRLRGSWWRFTSRPACALAALARSRLPLPGPIPPHTRSSHNQSAPDTSSHFPRAPPSPVVPGVHIPATSSTHGTLPALRQALHQSPAELAATVLADADTMVKNQLVIVGLCQQLDAALRGGDFTAVTELWSQLRGFGPSNPSPLPLYAFFTSYSDTLRTIYDSGHPVPSHVIPTLGEILTHCAAMGLIQGARAHMEFFLRYRDPGSALEFIVGLVEATKSRRAKLGALHFSHLHEASRRMDGKYFKRIPVELVTCALVASFMLKTFSPLLHLTPIALRPDVLQGAVMVAAERYKLPEDALVYWTMRLCELSLLGLPVESFRSYVSHIRPSNIKMSPLPHIAARLVQELSRQDPQLTLDPVVAANSTHPIILFSHEHWALLMRTLVRGGAVEAARRLWIDMHRLVGYTPPPVQAAIIEGFASVKSFDRARAAWKAFTSNNQTPTAAVYQAYLKVLFLEGDTANAMAEFKRFEQDLRKRGQAQIGHAPAETSVFNVVVEWLTSQGRDDEARELLDRMRKMGPQPNIVSFNILMRHYRRTQDSQGVTDVMREMVALGLHGDVYTASLLLPAIIHMRTDAVQVVLAMLRKDGIVVDRDLYITLLQHLVRADDDASFDAALAILDHIENEHELNVAGIIPGIVLEGIERRVWPDSALADHYRRAVKKKMDRGRYREYISSEDSMVKLIDACCANPTLDALYRAVHYFEQHTQVKRERKGHDRVIFGRAAGILLGHLICRNEWSFADELVYDMTQEANYQASPGLQELIAQVRARDDRGMVVEDEMAEWM